MPDLGAAAFQFEAAALFGRTTRWKTAPIARHDTGGKRLARLGPGKARREQHASPQSPEHALLLQNVAMTGEMECVIPEA
ncbi:hypothetical protein ASG25_08640 [Rhizobium sp. Leaf384]|nr:hypothetical protein ASG03_04030 [Rhizobium sp. Leaf341]KQS75366.1 hypothetical protein ASG58_14820 [Rhizobium sp. Leaf383]KQS78718.1 hypothetical protein ASG25_08640 [Rhizobium sp. Leaf384]